MANRLSNGPNWSEKVDLKESKEIDVPPATRSIPSTGAHPIGLRCEVAFGRFWRTKQISLFLSIFY